MNLTEHQIQDQIIQYLRTKHYYVQRLNAGQYSMGEGRYKRFVMGVAAGTPDIMAFKEGYQCPNCGERHLKLLFVECKRPGKKATLLQEAKMEELEEYGARCIIATSVDDLIALGI